MTARIFKKDEKYITKIFPELNLIKSSEIKMKVVRAWLLALERSHWKTIEEVPFIPNYPDLKNIEHTRAATLGSIKLGEVIKKVHKINVDMDFVIAGANLHDIGKLIEYDLGKKTYIGMLLRHPFIGAHLALEAGLPPEVAHIIAAHSVEGETQGWKRSIEAIIVRAGDFCSAHTFALSKTGKTTTQLLQEIGEK
ncbi:MAG: HD domain-containing protein [Candidatus Bathyarchaeia archaeon]